MKRTKKLYKGKKKHSTHYANLMRAKEFRDMMKKVGWHR